MVEEISDPKCVCYVFIDGEKVYFETIFPENGPLAGIFSASRQEASILTKADKETLFRQYCGNDLFSEEI